MSQNNYLSNLSLVLVPLVLGGVIGWGVITTTVDYLETNMTLLTKSDAAQQKQINFLLQNDAVKMETLSGLKGAIDELNVNLAEGRAAYSSVRADLYEVREDVARLDERSGGG